MTGFTSGKISHDPEPWVDKSGTNYPDGRRATKAQCFGKPLYAPRPEFDHHNPILRFFREEVGRYGNPAHGDYAHWLEPLTTPGRMTVYGQVLTSEQIDHARRVLTHLANLTRTETS